jgi:predicted TIM-barrel fold metal-dependent hydrolase
MRACRALPLGHSGIGTGVAGGGGLRLKYSNPMCLDDVAADFPFAPGRARAPVVPLAGRGDLDLPAQGQRLDRPLRLVAEVLPAAARPVREHPAANKVLFGSDFPLITPDRWLADFEQAPFKDEVRPSS